MLRTSLLTTAATGPPGGSIAAPRTQWSPAALSTFTVVTPGRHIWSTPRSGTAN